MSSSDSTPPPPVPERIDLTLVDRYLAGESTPPERAQVEAWAAVSPEHETVVRTFQGILPGKQMDVANQEGAVRPRRPRILVAQARPRRMVWYATVSLAVGILGIVLGWNSLAGRFSSRVSAKPSLYTTANGERANITLSDGSTVALDVGSRLEVPADFAAGNHTVRLTGEALFTVLHHGGSPFTVVAGGATARVLGTSFAVRHYDTDTSAIVAVRDGRVAVGPTVVVADRMVEVGRHGKVRLGNSDGSLFSFTAGVLKLHSMPLSRAVTELDRWYAADVRLGDPSMGTIPIEGKFTAGSLSDLSSILGLMLDVRVVRDGHVLTLYPRAR